MVRDQEERMLRALEKANQCEAAEWHWTSYTRETERLVLSACGKDLDFFAYLVFRRPLYVCLTSFLVDAQFRLLREGDALGGDQALPQLPSKDAIAVAINSSHGDFCVVSKAVEFYRPTEG